MNGRLVLFRGLQVFFETELCGLYRWDQVAHYVPEHSEPEPGKRKNIYGKYKEIVVVRFGDYDLSVFSPNQDPPLGWIMLNHHHGDTLIEGPLDAVTWSKVGEFIKSQAKKDAA